MASNSQAAIATGQASAVRPSVPKPKNAPGNRSDPSWKYGVSVDGRTLKIKCKFCERTITGGVYRFKHHLAGTNRNVIVCKAVTDEVKQEMFQIVINLQKMGW
jgi:hypothetical protein